MGQHCLIFPSKVNVQDFVCTWKPCQA